MNEIDNPNYDNYSVSDYKKVDDLKINNEKLAYNVEDVAKLLGICSNTARILIHSKGFPKIVIGRRIIVPIKAFHDWLNSTGNF